MTKAKQRCPECGISATLCMCAELPRLQLRTRVVLVMHHREVARSSNTGLLALRSLINSELRIRGESRTPLDLSELLTPNYRTLLFYPSDDAMELDREFVARDGRPIQLIVPDGTWRQARKLHTRQPELRDIPRVKIAQRNFDMVQLRAQTRPEGMATLQALANALGVIEGENVADELLQLYQARVERTLAARGLLQVYKNWAAR